MTTSVIIVITATILVTSQLASGTGDPILLVPGLTGSRLNVKHTHSSLPRCNTPGGNVLLWISEVRFFKKFSCVSQEMKLSFDRNTSQYSSSGDDITVTVPGFGDTNTVERLSTGLITFPYFEAFVEYFVERGYKRGKNIRAAPYDWRLAPVELQRRGYFDNLKGLIETMYRKNGNTKVTIVAHSMGGPTVLHFLTSGIVTQLWKDTYIGNFITLSAAWSGGNRALQAAVSGLDFNGKCWRGNTFSIFQFLDEKIENSFTPIIRSLQSIFFLFPRPSVWQNTILVRTPTHNYTANDYERLFSDIRFTDGYTKFKGIESINLNWPAPNVPTHCFYGVGVDTPLSFYYRMPFPRGARNDPEVTMGDGDGTVNTPSSEVCLKWAGSDYPFNSKTFKNVDHLRIIKDKRVLLEVGKVVGAPANPLTLWERFLKWFS